jgi:cytochrome c biogenesis protein CcdA/thiol-disulfide isomerase/thioredoxin
MTIAVLAFLGGLLTILSPCILPVLPFVFSRTGQPFFRSTAPLLLGMGVTFAGVATLAAVGGAWAVRINDYGRLLALALLAASGLALLSEHVANLLTRPFAVLGNRLLSTSGSTTGVLPSLILGVATGFLWAPCAGPILGLILTGAALNGPGAQTTLLLFAYALGAIASLALATLAGGRVFAAMKQTFGVGHWLRRGLGAAVLIGVLAIALGWDTGVLTRLSLTGTNRVEQTLLDRIHPDASPSAAAAITVGAMTGGAMTGGAMTGGAMTGGAMMSNRVPGASTPEEGNIPPLDGAVQWLNSPPLTPETLRGKVVMIDFWTYSCINCLRALPYVKSWYQRYKDDGLIVIGVHSPEFAFEKNERNVRSAVRDLGITYPVALDNNYAIWQAFGNRYWPAHYFIDGKGHIRGHHFGEGNYEESEETIRQLLSEGGAENLPPATLNVKDAGVEAASDPKKVNSPETYIGYERAENFSSPGGSAHDETKVYNAPASLELNHWALGGSWRVEAERAVGTSSNGTVVFRFHARDLHLVLGPGMEGKAVRFRVTLDGKAPGESHGVDIGVDGIGTVRDHRLYQLIRQPGAVDDRTFAIEFLDPGIQVYSFTFG